MLFHSFTFAILLAVALPAYWASRNQTLRLTILFAASMTFYAWHHWPSAFLLLGTIVANWFAALHTRRRGVLPAIITLDLGILFFFKYLGFVVSQFVAREATPGPAWLPLGISFFTFQVIAYQIDVHRGVVEPEPSILRFAVFKSFFAQLIAGPIVRAKDMLPRLKERAVFDPARFHHGVFLFLAGLGLKIGVADVLRQFSDEAFARGAAQPTTDAWLGIYAFAFQLFADFWGYSTMARGLGELFGLELPTNFDAPYIATSLQEFWRRWHITLSQWFRDYVYIPLGGNRVRASLNRVITMTVAGLWHGAGWNFIVWGFAHGVWLSVEGKTQPPRTVAARVLRTVLVFHGVCLLWVLFRAPSLTAAGEYLGRLVLPPYTGHTAVPETLSIWLVAFALLHVPLTRVLDRERFAAMHVRTQVAISAALVLLALAYAGQRYDFIYFAF